MEGLACSKPIPNSLSRFPQIDVLFSYMGNALHRVCRLHDIDGVSVHNGQSPLNAAPALGSSRVLLFPYRQIALDQAHQLLQIQSLFIQFEVIGALQVDVVPGHGDGLFDDLHSLCVLKLVSSWLSTLELK
jgi:hypothetical protein